MKSAELKAGASSVTPRVSRLPTIAVTAGEPAGIGPDLCILIAGEPFDARLVVIADRGMLEERARLLGIPVKLADFVPGVGSKAEAASITVLHQPLAAPAKPGILNTANARYVLNILERATHGCLAGEFAAMVTAPVHKGVINDAGILFTGHTEFLAERTGTPHVVMMLAGGGMRVALATTHLALKDVARAITAESLERTLRILHHDLAARFGIAGPRIVVAGLNPHAGESGYLGREELDIIIPVLNKLRAEGMQLTGPLPADTLFNRERLRQCECVLSMYHDQGLPVLKYASFGHGVNVTLGLPIIRTSVDHGTAIELAGTGRIEHGSMVEAVKTAIEMVRTTKTR